MALLPHILSSVAESEKRVPGIQWTSYQLRSSLFKA